MKNHSHDVPEGEDDQGFLKRYGIEMTSDGLLNPNKKKRKLTIKQRKEMEKEKKKKLKEEEQKKKDEEEEKRLEYVNRQKFNRICHR